MLSHWSSARLCRSCEAELVAPLLLAGIFHAASLLSSGETLDCSWEQLYCMLCQLRCVVQVLTASRTGASKPYVHAYK